MNFIIDDALFRQHAVVVWNFHHTNHMRVWRWYLDPVIGCRVHRTINRGCSSLWRIWLVSFWWISLLMKPCSEIMLLLYGPFITRTRCTCEDGIWIRWWDVAYITQSMGGGWSSLWQIWFLSFLMDFIIDDAMFIEQAVVEWTLHHTRYMRVLGSYLDQVMACRLHHPINGGVAAHYCGNFFFCIFW